MNCDHCGADRVTALANYRGYTPPASVLTSMSATEESTPSQRIAEHDICWKCSEIIPKGSLYCPSCGTMLIDTCPKCGYKYPSRFAFCGACGTNRESYLQHLEEERRRKEDEERIVILKQQEIERKKKEEEEKRIIEERRKNEDQKRLMNVVYDSPIYRSTLAYLNDCLCTISHRGCRFSVIPGAWILLLLTLFGITIGIWGLVTEAIDFDVIMIGGMPAGFIGLAISLSWISNSEFHLLTDKKQEELFRQYIASHPIADEQQKDIIEFLLSTGKLNYHTKNSINTEKIRDLIIHAMMSLHMSVDCNGTTITWR